MKLDKVQLQHISAFISKRGFTHYDLKLEILDHVACRVEEMMTADPGLQLDNAISIAHGEFGVNGFSVFEDALRTSLRKRYWAISRQTFLWYLQPKFLPIVLGAGYLIFILTKAIGKTEVVFYSSWGLLILSIVVDGLINYRKLKRYRSMLSMQMGNISIIALNVVFQLYNGLHSALNASHRVYVDAPFIFCSIFIVITALYYATMMRVQKVALENCKELEEQYQLTIGT